jgi:hypothetical protein
VRCDHQGGNGHGGLEEDDRKYGSDALAAGDPYAAARVLGLATAGRNFGAALFPVRSSFTDPNVTIMITSVL